MTSRAVTRQYAHALFDVAKKSGRIEAVSRDLSEFVALVSSHDDLRRVVSNPAVSATQKKALVQALLDSAGEVTDEVRRFLLLVAERDRLALLNDMLAAYLDRVMDAAGIVRAEITTAAPLEAAPKAALISALAKAVGREVTVTEKIDPEIIAGVRATVGGVVFDGTVTRQLERLRETLLAGV